MTSTYDSWHEAAKAGHVQPGACTGCGATNYPPSMGGPGICPACDCLPPEKRVRQLAEENRMLRARVAELEAMPRLVPVDESEDGVVMACTDPACRHFTCPRCGMVSHHPEDRREGYCGRCHDWTADPEPD